MNENFQNKYEELKKEYDNMSKEMEKIISKYSSCNNELVKITHEYNELLLTNKVLSNNSKMITASSKEVKEGSKEVKAGSKEVKAGSNIKTIINNNGIHELDRPQRLKRKFINKPYLFYNDSKFLYLRPIKFLFTSYNKNNLLGKLRTKLLTKILY